MLRPEILVAIRVQLSPRLRRVVRLVLLSLLVLSWMVKGRSFLLLLPPLLDTAFEDFDPLFSRTFQLVPMLCETFGHVLLICATSTLSRTNPIVHFLSHLQCNSQRFGNESRVSFISISFVTASPDTIRWAKISCPT